MKYTIKVLGYVQPLPCPWVGQYLEWFDPYADAWGDAVVAGFTADIDKAMKFDSVWMATQKWKHPLLDGHNIPRRRCDAPDATGAEEGVERPLTAFTVAIDPVDE